MSLIGLVFIASVVFVILWAAVSCLAAWMETH